jgi:hypothetical protein
MTPARRIKRIQRWLTHEAHAAEFVHPYNFGALGSSYSMRHGARTDYANELFTAELQWLCEYAQDLEGTLAQCPY